MVCKKCGYSAGPEEKLDHCPMCDARWHDSRAEDSGGAGGGDSWRQHSGLYITAGVVAVGLILLLVLLLGGRSGGLGGGGLPATGSFASTSLATGAALAQGPITYTDTSFGYSFEYPAEWQILQGTTGDGTVGAAAGGSVSVVDPAGSVAGGEYVDLLHVSVYQLTAAVDESMMADILPEVEAVVADLQGQGNDTQVVEALAETSAAGMPGFRVTISFTVEAVPVTSTMYFLFSGDIEYQLTLQAATENWEAKSPTLEAILASFRPGAAN